MLKVCRRGVWIALAVAAADRLTKNWALAKTAGGDAALIPGFLRLTRAANTGGAFSLLSGHGMLMSVITALMLLLLIGLLLADRPRFSSLTRTGLWMIVGGGLGNLYDRLTAGFVTDFLQTEFIVFPIFNLADVCVVLGALAAAVGLLRTPEDRSHG